MTKPRARASGPRVTHSFVTTHEDGTPLGAPNFRAVGWLGRARAFRTGDVERPFAIALAALAVNPWQRGVSAGVHFCELCRFSGGPGSVKFGEHTVRIGADDLFVPDGDICWIAPTTIVHYVDAHSYRPPDEFMAAVQACPPMRSVEYLRALLTTGVTKHAPDV